jgi:CheY-like chemotaxis protein/two-component sensor histidine kinase
MEAAGVAAAAAERVSRARFIAVRGVSDLADERKSGFDGVRAGSIRTAAMSNALGLLGTLASLGAFSPDVLNHGNKLLVAGHGNAAPETSKVEDLTGNLIAWMLRPLPSGSDLSGICILFVDDESNILELLGRFASDRGAKSLLANDGIEALDFLAKCAQVDIVVTDLYMPRMDGFSLAQTIAAKWPTLPVIFQSGYLDLANLDRINKVTNCVAALSKPYDREYIVSVIADVYRDNIRQVLVTALPELSQCYDLLFDCRSHIASFMRSFNGVSLFETAFRHKIKDSVASFARTIISGANPKLAVDKLAHELSKLTSLLRGAKVSQPHALIEFFETFVKDMRKQTKGIDLRLDLDPEVAVHLEPDSAMLICIALIELVDNAVEALNGKGEVRVVLSRLEVRRCILLQVCSPTGPLDEELAERIFEEGYSTKGPERGMGLSILRRLAERLGGHLNLSQSDGVEFCITLPFLRTEP